MVNMNLIFRLIEFISGKDRFYFWTGANDIHTSCARDELENAGVIYAVGDVYNYSSEDGFDPRLSIGLGDLNIFQRLRVRFILWLGGVKGRLWYTI